MSDNNSDTPAPQPGAYPPPAPGAYPPPAQGAPQPAPPAYGAPPVYGSAPQYGAPQFGAAPQYGAPAYGYGAPAKTNTLAIVSLIASISAFVILPFIGSIVGVITGHMALGQLKTNGEQGRGLALAGTIIGWVGLALTILGTILFFAFISYFATLAPSSFS